MDIKKTKIESGSGIFLEFESNATESVARLVKVCYKDGAIVEEAMPLFGNSSTIQLSNFIDAVENKLSLANFDNFTNYCSQHDEPREPTTHKGHEEPKL